MVEIETASLQLVLPRDTGCLSDVRRAVMGLASRAGFTAGAAAEIEMAVDEAVANAILHADGTVALEASVDGRGMTITLVGGPHFTLEGAGAESIDAWHESRSQGGLGVLIMRSFMDEVECLHEPRVGNALRMRKYLAS